MTHGSNARLHIRRNTGVVYARIDNPPVNVLDVALMTEVHGFVEQMKNDKEALVVVFESADPDFFIAHVDMAPVDTPEVFGPLAASAPPPLNLFQALNEALRSLPQVTIAKLAGLARGGGSEFVMALDMRFAALGKAGLAQCEAPMGIVPGGGATQYLTSLVGRARALEAILGARLFDAATAEPYGWVNRALSAEELDAFVDKLAHDIAALPPGVMASVKEAVGQHDLRAARAIVTVAAGHRVCSEAVRHGGRGHARSLMRGRFESGLSTTWGGMHTAMHTARGVIGGTFE
jgi:enoyl-CoA hydratase/carnithine racemase